MTDLRSGVGRNVTLDIALVTGYALVATLLIVTEAISGATRVAVAAPLVGFLRDTRCSQRSSPPPTAARAGR